MPHSHGPRHRTRKILRKHKRYRGLPPPARVLIDFKVGEQVVIDINPSVHKGMPFPRFQGKQGRIIERRGRAYVIAIKDGDKIKKVIARPEHIKRITG